ncbi:MAG: hypothetical protein ACXV8Q_03445 [Methylobacter sp.]
MTFTIGTDFAIGPGFTTGLDFNFTVPTTQANMACVLSGVAGSFSGNLSAPQQASLQGELAGVSGVFDANAVTLRADVSGVLTGVSGALLGGIEVPRQAELLGQLDGVAGSFEGHNFSYEGVINATMDGLSGAITASYDPNVHRYTVVSTRSDQQAAGSLAHKGCFAYQQAVPIHAAVHAEQLDAYPLYANTQVTVNGTVPLDHELAVPVDEATDLSVQVQSVSDRLTPTPISRCGTVDDATPLWSSLVAGFDLLEFIITTSRHPVDDSTETTRDNLVSITVAYSPPFTLGADFDVAPGFTLGCDFNFGGGPVTTVYKERTEKAGWRQSVTGKLQTVKRTFRRQCSTVQDARRPLPGTSIPVDPPRLPPVVDPGHTTHTIPEQTAYIMQHNLSVTLLDLTPIQMQSVNLSFDAESFAWQFKGTLLDKAQLPLVQQMGGPPVQLIVTINGYSWKVLVERIEHSRQFAGRSITLSGRGLTALLSQPYEQPASATQGSLLTVQQIAELLLPIGWTLNWQTVVWNIPAGAYSYTNQTPIQALGALASDIGAMLVPSRNAQSLAVKPRYPVLPWDFFNVPADVVISESALVNLSQRPIVPYQANGVYVHGGEVGGVIGWCRFNSTAGDRLAPTVSNALMTDVIGARAVGERILAGQYTQPAIQSATLPMDGSTLPLIEVGQLVQLTVDATPVRGIVSGVSIDANLSSVRQTIQIGEETPNTWAIFKELLPRDPLLFSTLVETDGTTSLMSLLDNGVVRVRGTGTVGGKYYIRAGKIDGEAPSMAQSEIVI